MMGKKIDKRTGLEKKIGSNPSSKYHVDTLLPAFEKYITETDYPIVKEFLLLNKLSMTPFRNAMNYLDSIGDTRLSELLEASISKKEVFLEKKAIAGEIDTKFAMFILKQPCHGWRDKVEVEAKADLNLNINVIYK